MEAAWGRPMTLVVAGDGSRTLATEIATRIGATLVAAEVQAFPDGEDYVRVPATLKDEDVIVVQSTYPPSRLWRLLLTLQACREGGARTVKAVAPYLAYARQDRIFKPGEALSAKLIAQALGLVCNAVITVDAHKDDIRAFYNVPFVNVGAEAALAKELKRLKVQVVLAPDAGAVDRARSISERIGAQFDHLEKKRISSEVVEITPKSLNVAGKSVCIVDDIISTGGTMAKALEQLKKNGAREVHAACVHGLFIGDAWQKLRRAGAIEIFASNTIEGPFSRVSVVDEIVAALTAKVPATLKR